VSRLDQALVERGLAPTRSRARDLIVRGLVAVDGIAVAKPGATIGADAVLTLAPDAPRFVSRGAEKLVAGLDHFRFDPGGLVCLDIGASTGGFTEVLLARGATHVNAVDVGRGQLHPTLAADPRVSSSEGKDARDLTAADIGGPVDVLVADVSFIALAKALPAGLELVKPGGWMVALVKPQFEVGPEHIGKGGIVRDEAQQLAAVDTVADWLSKRGWRIVGTLPSPILGGSGNKEYLIGARRD
jgi:23S rRNA (cytidine1920-2'-O)/16S rRNA (cytidine1409-2'-O)-methyltransferase